MLPHRGAIWIDRGVKLAHAKVVIIDRKLVLTGSMNFHRRRGTELGKCRSHLL